MTIKRSFRGYNPVPRTGRGDGQGAVLGRMTPLSQGSVKPSQVREARRRTERGGGFQFDDDVIFPGSPAAWDLIYSGENATTSAWTATKGPNMGANSTQIVGVSTAGVTLSAARTDNAVTTDTTGGNTGWTSTSNDGNLSQADFTVRMLANLTEQASGDVVISLTNFFGSGADYYWRLQHATGTVFVIVTNDATGNDSQVFTAANVSYTFGTWALWDLYHQAGVGTTIRVNGTEFVLADTGTKDPTANGFNFDVGVGCFAPDTTSGQADAQTIMALGVAPGDLGLTAHTNVATALGLAP